MQTDQAPPPDDDKVSLAELFRRKLQLSPETTPLEIYEACMSFYDIATRANAEYATTRDHAITVAVEEIINEVADWIQANHDSDVAEDIRNIDWQLAVAERTKAPIPGSRSEEEVALEVLQQFDPKQLVPKAVLEGVARTAEQIIAMIDPSCPASAALVEQIHARFIPDDITRAQALNFLKKGG